VAGLPVAAARIRRKTPAHHWDVFAVISDGFENSFRHPHPKVLERLSAHRAGILRTDRDGLVTIRTDGRRISIETFLPR
jgi:beta-lactamase superfamily II metal-dependent hydrolase